MIDISHLSREEFSEERGYCNEVGFVKNNPKNNESYVAKCIEAFEKAFRDTGRFEGYGQRILDHYNMLVDSGRPFNIIQIKEKFGLCIYAQYTDDAGGSAYL